MMMVELWGFLPVDVVLAVGWEIVVDDEGHLLDVDTTSKQIGGDENAGRAAAELLPVRIKEKG